MARKAQEKQQQCVGDSQGLSREQLQQQAVPVRNVPQEYFWNQAQVKGLKVEFYWEGGAVLRQLVPDRPEWQQSQDQHFQQKGGFGGFSIIVWYTNIVVIK